MPGAKPYGQLRYKEINGKRMAYIDEGQGDAIVFQHGNPTSSYLWRNVMPHLDGLGRLIACDLIGMGGSDKLDDSGPDRYHYAEQRDYLFALWDALELGDRVIFVLHDWGSALGFDWANQHRDRVAGLAFMEAIAMPIDWSDFPEPVRAVFQGFRSPQGEAMVLDNNMFVEAVLPGAILRTLSDEEMDQYRRPFRNPARTGGRRCRGRATYRSKVSRPTSSRSSATTAAGWRKATCRSCSSTDTPARSSAAASATSCAPGPTRPKSRCPGHISSRRTAPTRSARPSHPSSARSWRPARSPLP